MQGDLPGAKRGGRQFLLILAAAYVLAAGVVVFAVAAIGATLHPYVPAGLIVGAMAVVGATADLIAIRRRSFSLGPHRQTPKQLFHGGRWWWVTPLLWGLDTGLIGTTYRVSFGSWLLLLLALLGLAPPWAGLIYGLSFSVPLIIGVTLPRVAIDNPTSTRPRALPARPIQAVGVASMLGLYAWSVWAAVG